MRPATSHNPMNPFSEACGAPCPWRLSVEGQAAPAAAPDFDQPFVVIGQDEGTDLRLAHKDVSERHAYLQWVDGKLHVVDLGSRSGVLWEGRRRRAGWLTPGQSVRIGPYRVALPAGDGEDAPHEEGDDPVPALDLDIKVRGIRALKARAEGPLSLIGSAAECDVRLLDPAVANVHCALVNTPYGSWAVDLLGTGGMTLNGEHVRSAPVAQGDILTIGRSTVRIAGESWAGPAEANHDDSGPAVESPFEPRYEPAQPLAPAPWPSDAPEADDSAVQAEAEEPRPSAFSFSLWRRSPASQLRAMPEGHAAEEFGADEPVVSTRSPVPSSTDDPIPFAVPAGAERRTSCRYPIAGKTGQISWWETNGSPAPELRAVLDDVAGAASLVGRSLGFRGTGAAVAEPQAAVPKAKEKEKPQNRTVTVSLVDISQAGLAAMSPAAPARGERVWFRLDDDLSSDWIEMNLVGASRGADGQHLLRFAFREACPYDLFKTLVFGGGPPRT